MIRVKIEDYLVDGKDVGQTDKICFLPIFVTDPGVDAASVMNTWFIGSMFMDKYFVVNQNEYASNVPGMVQQYPLVGILDKWAGNKEKEPNVENDLLEGGFTTTIGHCTKDGLKKDVDWKLISEG